MAFYGRLQQGNNLNLWARTDTPQSEPGWPDVRPFTEIWQDGSPPTLIQTFEMASYLPGVIEGMFRSTTFLGPLYDTPGRYLVITRWVDQDGTPRQIAGSFELLGGGDEAGTILSMTEVARPDARYLLTSTDGGIIFRRKNPR